MKVVVLTGAGISAESGIPTYRDRGGRWDNYDVNKTSTSEALIKNRAEVIEFYNMIRSDMCDKLPNAAHLALVELEKYHEVTIVTQNIDNLHEAAGSSNVLHVHGQIFEKRHGGEVRFDKGSIDPASNWRPNVVLFGEDLMVQEPVMDALMSADIFVSVGTSGSVYPVASYVDRVNNLNKAQTVEINPNSTANSHKFERKIRAVGTIGVVEYVRELCDV